MMPFNFSTDQNYVITEMKIKINEVCKALLQQNLVLKLVLTSEGLTSLKLSNLLNRAAVFQ